jgi:hypothetical protein
LRASAYLVPAPVPANEISRGEDPQDVGVEFIGCARGVPAEARSGPRLLVYLAIIADEVIGREGGLEVVGDGLVVEFREATRATHVSIFPLSAFIVVERLLVVETFPCRGKEKSPQPGMLPLKLSR